MPSAAHNTPKRGGDVHASLLLYPRSVNYQLLNGLQTFNTTRCPTSGTSVGKRCKQMSENRGALAREVDKQMQFPTLLCSVMFAASNLPSENVPLEIRNVPAHLSDSGRPNRPGWGEKRVEKAGRTPV